MSTADLLLLGFNTALIGMGIVFIVLIVLELVVTLQSRILHRKEKAVPHHEGERVIQSAAEELPAAKEEDDEIRAAIMAAVCAAEGVSPDRLNFKSIRAV